jgi:hypothetical protein
MRKLSAKIWLTSLLAGLLLAACTGPVIPRPTHDTVPSYDGNAQNSGFLGFLPSGGAVITPRAKAKYDGLVGLYGAREIPPVKLGDGLQSFTNGTWIIDAEHLVDFQVWNAWRKEGRP